MIKQLQIIADEVKLNKCGNCGEFAILAFMYLFKKKVVPIDWVSLKGADHAFVIIGRDSGDPSKVAKWGPNAVICDPWARGFHGNHVDSGTYPGTDFSLKMRNLIGSFSGINSLHRED
jgi:hypothetical protein